MNSPNNRFQRTSHKVRRPLNRDVGHKKQMKKLILALSLSMAPVFAVGAVDYAVNVWISTAGANVVYSLGKGPSTLDEIQDAVRKVADLDPSQTVHLIANEKTAMASLFTLSKLILDAGLTNIFASVSIDADASQPSNGVIRMQGMSLDINDVHDYELEEIESVQQGGPGYPPQGVGSPDP